MIETLTVAEAVAEAERRLAAAGVEEGRLEARLIVEAATGFSRAQALALGARQLRGEERARLEALVERRAAREPLSYVLGHREFFGLDFFVDRRVLVPRPETEILVEESVRRLSGVVSPRIADVGTGSGAIAVALAASLPTARVVAIDVSVDALAVAGRNAARHGVCERVAFAHGDLLDGQPGPFDLVVANLPYVASADVDAAAPEVRQEPRLALDGGPDGFDAYRRLLAQVPSRIASGGALIFEVAFDQGAKAVALAERAFPGAAVRLLRDLAGLDRFVVVEVPRTSAARPCV